MLFWDVLRVGQGGRQVPQVRASRCCSLESPPPLVSGRLSGGRVPAPPASSALPADLWISRSEPEGSLHVCLITSPPFP